MARDIDLIRFNALRNALYHTGRRRTFERWNRWFNFAVVVLGTASFGQLLVSIGQPTWQIYIGGAVALVGTLQLVFDFGGQARTHQSLQRDYYNILAETEESSDCSEDECRKWEGKMVRIAGDEPPVFRALDARAYNDALDAMEWSRGERLRIPLIHRILGNFIPFEGYNYPKLSEISQRTLPSAQLN